MIFQCCEHRQDTMACLLVVEDRPVLYIQSPRDCAVFIRLADVMILIS